MIDMDGNYAWAIPLSLAQVAAIAGAIIFTVAYIFDRKFRDAVHHVIVLAVTKGITAAKSILSLFPRLGAKVAGAIASAVSSKIIISKINNRLAQKYKKDLLVQSKGKSNPRDLEKGMSKNQKEKFQRAIEDFKGGRGMPPNYNLPWPLLVELAEEIKRNFK